MFFVISFSKLFSILYCEEMILLHCLKFLICLLLLVVVAIPIGTSAESTDESYGEIVVIEAKLELDACCAIENSELIKLCKSNGNDLIYYQLLETDSNGFLGYENGIGEFESLLDKNGVKIKAENDATVSVVYDVVLGIARYYVNNQMAYCRTTTPELVPNIQAGGDFFVFEGRLADVLCGDVLENVEKYSDRGLGTAEIIAMQEHLVENKLRILAGVDSLAFSSIGFSVCVYENGVMKGEKHIYSGDVFERITAEGIPVFAKDYNFDYFAALEISDISLNSNKYYVTVRPFTEIGRDRFYGKITGITLDENASFDANCKTLGLDGGNRISLELDCVGNVYACVASPCAAEMQVYVDGNEVGTVSVGIGRNNFLISSVESGKHRIEIACDNEVLINSLTYFAVPCEHKVDASAAWRIEKSQFFATCELCGGNIAFSEAESPAFELDFETDVSAADYDGFSVVSPKEYTVGTDVDGDKALVAGENKFYVDVEASALAKMKYYLLSFDLTVSKQGLADSEISLLTLISNFRDGAKISGIKADYAYFFKYNTNNKTISTIDINGDEKLLNSSNSISVEVGKQYKFSAIVDTEARIAHIFVGDTYLGCSEKQLADVSEKVYPSFKFNDGGACYPIFDNFRIVELK